MIRTTTLLMLFAVSTMAAPLGTEFTYQGVLADGGVPASGDFDFRFLLYDADVGGSQVGSIVYVEDVTATEGRFTTQLDFGSVFDGIALWLEVGVREGSSTGTYTVLSPRQELTAAPFAQHAQTAEIAVTAGHSATADSATSAGYATTAGDADTLNGQPGSFYLTWSNFLDIPADLADGDDDTLADLGCATDEIAKWDGAAWNCSGDDDTPFVRTYVVGPVGGNLANGTALIDAIANIPVPVNKDFSVLVKLEPGVYDLGTDALALDQWMAIEGSGKDVTVVRSAFCGSAYTGTIFSFGTSMGIGLRHLTVENTCADPAGLSVAFSNQGDLARVEFAKLSANGAALDGYAMVNSGGAVTLANTTLYVNFATGTTVGLSNSGGSVNLTDVVVTIVSGDSAKGIDSSGPYFVFRRGQVIVSHGTSDCEAVKIVNDDHATLTGVVLNSGCVGAENLGLRLTDSNAFVTDSRIDGGTGIRVQTWGPARFLQFHNVNVFSSEVGLWCEDSGTNGTSVKITRSVLSAGVDAIHNGGLACAIGIGATQLDGGVSGAASCAGVYDGSFAFFASSCPPP